MKLKTVEKKITLAGGKIAGGNPEHGRVENDYYATNPKAVEMLFERYEVRGNTFLEPCVGGGHIAKAVDKLIGDKLEETTYLDIVDRGYPNTIVKDFLQYKTNKRYDIIISNPPYSLAQEFIEKSLSLLSSKGHCIMFLKLQFLEGAKRKEFFEKYPPKYIYVFRNRMATWNNGSEVDPNTSKRWATTMCHAWFIWEKDSNTEPIIRWL